MLTVPVIQPLPFGAGKKTSPTLGYFPPLPSPEYILKISLHCLRLFAQDPLRVASRARASAGSSIAARMPIMAMTTKTQ